MSIEYAVVLAIASPNHVSGLTKSRPHAMLPVLGKPMVVRVMNQLLQEGIKKFIVIVGINEGSVASYLNANWVPNVELDFVLKSDYESLSSTLAQVARKLNEPFFIVNYNTFTQPQFIPTALSLAENYPENLILAGTNSTLSQSEHNAFASMDGMDVNEILSTPPSDMESSQLIANMAVCGMQFVEFLQDLPKNIGTGSLHQQFIDILHIYANLSDRRITLGRTAWIMQVNSDPDLMLLNYQFLEEGRDAHILSELPPSVQVHYPVRIDPGVSIGHEATIGPYVYLEHGSSIGNGASIRRSMVLESASIPPNADVEDVIVSSNKIISSKIN
jgi:UDP-N-acetylglucosamine diphosphorylase / glucose-1-phosphate thymidylyltransferase / UDP-N-acetylgalactosamine diphosphorylase / glucosamine-1-phosphate N-acetyltransferase / galactosamine-1-phosphate N-acetyltransferase